MIDKNKQYKTRSGRDVVIYSTEGIDPYSVHGAIRYEDGWSVDSWTCDGSWRIGSEGKNDIVEIDVEDKS